MAVLCYNGYGLEGDGENGRIKRAAVLGMLRTLRERGVPIGSHVPSIRLEFM